MTPSSPWSDTVGEPDSLWPDTVPLTDSPRQVVRRSSRAKGPRPEFGAGWGSAAAQTLWFGSLTVGATVTLLVSHLGLDSHLGTYDVASVRELHSAGRWSLLVAVLTLGGLVLAALMRHRYRAALPFVAGQVLGVFFLGVPWAVLTTLLGTQIGWNSSSALGGLGGLVAGLLWLRLLTRCRGPSPGEGHIF